MNALTSKFVTLVFILAIASASAQTSGQYVLDWSTIDGGGGTSRGGSYVLTGTIGQPDAAYSAGGQYELLGGFLPGGPLCFVDFYSFARFAEYWLEAGEDLPADLYDDGENTVDWHDLEVFVGEWLYSCPYDWALR
ncbi:MAG: hypothetical protein ACYS6W_13115 [Planctomycetota bacterium]|jgi:hypothetical protein